MEILDPSTAFQKTGIDVLKLQSFRIILAGKPIYNEMLKEVYVNFVVAQNFLNSKTVYSREKLSIKKVIFFAYALLRSVVSFSNI